VLQAPRDSTQTHVVMALSRNLATLGSKYGKGFPSLGGKIWKLPLFFLPSGKYSLPGGRFRAPPGELVSWEHSIEPHRDGEGQTESGARFAWLPMYNPRVADPHFSVDVTARTTAANDELVHPDTWNRAIAPFAVSIPPGNVSHEPINRPATAGNLYRSWRSAPAC
jgi:hypothetical protein